jgi:hypothetical protein
LSLSWVFHFSLCLRVWFAVRASRWCANCSVIINRKSLPDSPAFVCPSS